MSAKLVFGKNFNVPILPEQELKILCHHAGIFSDYIDVQYRFGDNEVIRWQFPNSWGASLITTNHKHKDYYGDETDVDSVIEIKEIYSELVPLSYHVNKEGKVHYNNIINTPVREISVGDLVIVLSRIFGLNLRRILFLLLA